MKISLSRNELMNYIKHQLEYFFPDKYEFKGNDIVSALNLALDRLEYCYKFIADPAYHKENQTFFSHLHGDQFSQFVYYLMNSLWKISENKPICDKLIQLNRMLSGMFVTYNAGLPDIFYWVHPVGTVLGNANYGNFFFCCQNCTVATQENREGVGGSFGKGLFMGANSSIYSRNIQIGDRVAIGAGASVWDRKIIEDDTLVINGESGVEFKKRSRKRYNEEAIRSFVFGVDI